MIQAARSHQVIVRRSGGSVCDRICHYGIHLAGRVKGNIPMEEWLTEYGKYLTEADPEKAQARLFDRTATLSSKFLLASNRWPGLTSRIVSGISMGGPQMTGTVFQGRVPTRYRGREPSFAWSAKLHLVSVPVMDVQSGDVLKGVLQLFRRAWPMCRSVISTGATHLRSPVSFLSLEWRLVSLGCRACRTSTHLAARRRRSSGLYVSGTNRRRSTIMIAAQMMIT